MCVWACVLQSEMFQEDIYPDTASPNPSLSAEEWVAGQNADPVYVPIQVCPVSLSAHEFCNKCNDV